MQTEKLNHLANQKISRWNEEWDKVICFIKDLFIYE